MVYKESPASLIPSLSISGVGESPLENEEKPVEREKNKLANEVIKEQVARDKQRRLHRNIVFLIVAAFCPCFYISFLFIIFKLFWNVSSIPDLPVVLALPIVALITVPTIILVIVLLCLYREKTKIGVDTVVKVAESAISASK